MSTLDLDEAAAIAKCSRDTLRRMAARREVPSAKIGRRWVFSAALLQEWIDARCRSIAVPEAPIGGSALVAKLDAHLAQMTAGKRKNSSASSKRDSGAATSSATVVPFHGTKSQSGG